MRTAIQLFSRSVGPVSVSCVLTEKHLSEIGITTNPIETGAEVTDHAYVMPKKLTLEIADKNATATFNALVAFQESRVPFYIVSGWAVYKNMLIRSIDATRDAQFSSVLRATIELQEVIIVSTAYAAGDFGSDGNSGGQPGGENSTQQARPNPTRSNDAATADRAAGTVQRGDNPTVTVPPAQSGSLLSGLFA